MRTVLFRIPVRRPMPRPTITRLAQSDLKGSSPSRRRRIIRTTAPASFSTAKAIFTSSLARITERISSTAARCSPAGPTLAGRRRHRSGTKAGETRTGTDPNAAGKRMFRSCATPTTPCTSPSANGATLTNISMTPPTTPLFRISANRKAATGPSRSRWSFPNAASTRSIIKNSRSTSAGGSFCPQATSITRSAKLPNSAVTCAECFCFLLTAATPGASPKPARSTAAGSSHGTSAGSAKLSRPNNSPIPTSPDPPRSPPATACPIY